MALSFIPPTSLGVFLTPKFKLPGSTLSGDTAKSSTLGFLALIGSAITSRRVPMYEVDSLITRVPSAK